jgi:hypothetical protein
VLLVADNWDRMNSCASTPRSLAKSSSARDPRSTTGAPSGSCALTRSASVPAPPGARIHPSGRPHSGPLDQCGGEHSASAQSFCGQGRPAGHRGRWKGLPDKDTDVSWT